LSC
jgi:hypothetical protein